MSEYEVAMAAGKSWEQKALDAVVPDTQLRQMVPHSIMGRDASQADLGRTRASTYAVIAIMFYAKATALKDVNSWLPES